MNLEIYNKLKMRPGLSALLNAFMLVLTLFISAQEIPCTPNYSFVSSPKTALQTTGGHSEHCIKHQNPLPQIEACAQTQNLGSKLLLSLSAALVSGSSLLLENNSQIFISLFDRNDHLGVSVHKYLVRFLI